MDPLTHTLVGASLGATRLRNKTRAAVPALVLGANLPDLDVLTHFAGSDAALNFRRGWTHGIVGLCLLPALLALILWTIERHRGSRKPSGPGCSITSLIGLSYLATITHPILDWLNTYGMRWWMPFSGQWSYGDSVFIMDPWLWLMLGAGWLLGRPPTWRLATTGLTIMILLVAVTVGRAPHYVPIVVAVFCALLLALLWPPDGRGRLRTRAAGTGLACAVLYITGMIGLHAATEQTVRRELDILGLGPVDGLLVGPMPADPSRWDILIQLDSQYRFGTYSWLSQPRLALSDSTLPAAKSSEAWREVQQSGQARGFLAWARFPWIEVEETPNRRMIYVMDARYARDRTRGFGGAVIALDPAAGS